ncbi:protein FAR1-RELATED SEQUENCE 5-like [Chenopodium quinoa]|uniref:protein FAR1-RELATED SEQUENCE 5-like n=1 Tax=Chenopodium quinoa TaxID=63459 RepID=UPI000B77A9E5|nr:protein FAR1-RELATED SEQUENCE 5-like [Chenopodium quinoa]
MVYQSEFRHDSNARFVDDANDYDINDEGEVEGIVNLNEGFTEATESELFDRKVKSDEEAYDLYNSYAFKHGFGICKDRLNRRDDKDRTPRQRFLVCSFAGFKQEKKHGEQSKVYQKRNFRTGCKAHIQFDIDKVSGLYVVVNHTMVHNHSRVAVSKRHLIRSHRKVTNEQVVMMSSLTESSIPVADAVRVLKHQASGEANLSFLCRDAYGALSQHNKMMFDGCDAKRLLSYFKERKSSEYDFFYDFDVDEKGHLQSFFFRDNRMKVDYDAFGDLLVHDTTYRTNKYGMICGPFVGMNHHNNNVMFGIGFLINEKWESFEWLFNTFLKSMGGKHPVTIMTDQAQAMAKTIKVVFPNSRHRLCTWHIGENAKKNIKGLRAKEGFNDLFDIVLKYTDTIQEFEHYWSSMQKTYKCTDNKWLQNLYNIKEMWCPSYSKDYFSGGVMSSHRSETTNKSVSRRLHATHGLCDFYTTFIEVVDEWRSREGSNDYDSMTGNRHLVWADIGLLEHARKIYTIQIYLHFEDNFVNGVPCTAKVIGFQPPLYEYHVGHPKKDLIMHTVAFDESTVTVDCTCKYFGEVGLLCKHSLRVLHLNNITYIPKRYICKRWTKAAMCTRVDDNDVAEMGVTPCSVWRLYHIRTFITLVDRAQNDLSARAVIEEAIEECTARINLLMGEDKDVPPELSKTNEQDVTPEKGDGSLLEPAVIFEQLAEEHGGLEKEHGGFEREHGGIVKEHTVQVDVKDPIKKRKKGQKNTRWKSTQEKVSNKLKGQKIKSWRKKSAKGVSKMKHKAQTTIKDFLPVPDGNVLAHSNEFGGSLEFFEPDDYFGVNIREL